MSHPPFIGVDIGGTQSSVNLACLDGGSLRLVERDQFATDARRGPDPILRDIEARLERLMRTADYAGADGIGVSCGGPLDAARGIVQSPPNLPGWDEVPVADRLSSRFGLACWLENDANASALAEWQWGAAKGARHMAYLTFGTGLGAGLIMDERLYRGAAGLAGEIGHWTLQPGADGPVIYGARGTFEGFCSGNGLVKWYRHLMVDEGPDELSAAIIAERARGGEALARRVFDQSARALGQGIALLVDLLAPEVVVVGGIFSYAPDLFRPEMEAHFRSAALPATMSRCRVVPSALGRLTGSYASICVALDHTVGLPVTVRPESPVQP